MSEVLAFPRATLVLDSVDVAEQLRPLFETAIVTTVGKIEAECQRLDAELGRKTGPGHRRLTVRIDIGELLLAVARTHENYRISFHPA